MNYYEYFYIVMAKYLLIPTRAELLRFQWNHIFYIQSDGNYSKIFTIDEKSRLVPFQLGQIEDMIYEQDEDEDNEDCFIRVGKRLIVNSRYIYVVDLSENKITLSDHPGHCVKVEVARAPLITLKAALETKAALEKKEI